MPIYILQALNTETGLNCLWWQAWWFVTKKLRVIWTLSWNIQHKPLVILKKTHLFQAFSNNLYRTPLISSNNKRGMCSKITPPFFLKSQMWLLFMADHSRYGCHYVKDIPCSTDLRRGRGSEEFTLPHLLQDMGELVHVNRGGAVFIYSSKNWWEPNLASGRQEICDDPSSVRSGIVVLQSVALGSHPCSVGQLGGPEWRRIVFYRWGGYMPTHITDLPP